LKGGDDEGPRKKDRGNWKQSITSGYQKQNLPVEKGESGGSEKGKRVIKIRKLSPVK